MDRRDFLRVAGAAGLIPAQAGAAGLIQAVTRPAESADSWMGDFSRAEAESPWTLGYRSAAAELRGQATVRGRFPAAVQGVLFRNGPAMHDLGGMRYHHWFDGDGMIQRFVIGERDVGHLGKVVRTPKYQAESAAGRRIFATFGTDWPGAQPPTSPDSLNPANTSVLPIGDELLALWEGGSAYRLDAATLDTLGAKVWRDDLSAVPFSAHPRIDADGTVWNFGVSMRDDMMVLYEIGADGRLRRAEALKVPQIAMVHDFAITQRHLVFLLPPLVFERERLQGGASLLDSHVWKPELATRVLLVDKADWGRRQWMELPAGFLFHLGNAWEDAAGVIRLDYIHADEPAVLFRTLREVMRGHLEPSPIPRIALARLDTAKGAASQELLPIGAEFPRIDARLTGARYAHVIHATDIHARRAGYAAVARTNIDTGKTERYSYGADHITEEHLFVPAHGSAPGGAGWILGTSLDLTHRCTRLSCFEAGRLSAGPVAQATLPYALPLGLHGAFVKG